VRQLPKHAKLPRAQQNCLARGRGLLSFSLRMLNKCGGGDPASTRSVVPARALERTQQPPIHILTQEGRGGCHCTPWPPSGDLMPLLNPNWMKAASGPVPLDAGLCQRWECLAVELSLQAGDARHKLFKGRRLRHKHFTHGSVIVTQLRAKLHCWYKTERTQGGCLVGCLGVSK